MKQGKMGARPPLRYYLENVLGVSRTGPGGFSQNENAANADTQKDQMQNMQLIGFIVIGSKALYEPHDNYQ